MNHLTSASRRRYSRISLEAFTLVEILVTVAVVAIMLTLFLQLLSGTMATIAASNKQIDTASLARITLDRFGNDFSGAILRAGSTALYYSEPGNSGNSVITFVTESRARGPSGTTATWTTDTRSAFVGYKVRLVAQNVGGTNTPSLPSLNRGDARFTFSVQSVGSSSYASYRLWDMFGARNTRLPNDLISDASNDQRAINWGIIAGAIFRFHISFVLDDGRIVQTPPAYQNFFANGGTGTCTPIAFSPNSVAVGGQYVKGLIVGLAVLDETTRNLAYRADNSFSTTISNKILRPTTDGQTPVQVWSDNLATLTSNTPGDPNYLFPPIRQSLRFYQRFYSVTL